MQENTMGISETCEHNHESHLHAKHLTGCWVALWRYYHTD